MFAQFLRTDFMMAYFHAMVQSCDAYFSTTERAHAIKDSDLQKPIKLIISTLTLRYN